MFGVERSYPITYRDFPPRKLIPPAFDQFAVRYGAPDGVCKALNQSPVDAACTAAWRELWAGFWQEATPRFSHLLTWAMPPEARPMIPGGLPSGFRREVSSRSTRDNIRNLTLSGNLSMTRISSVSGA